MKDVTEGSGPVLVESGEWAGWSNWPSDKWETYGGPFYFRRDEAGVVRCAFRAEEKHMNTQGHMHGGVMMTFADFVTFGIASEILGVGKAVTVTMNCEFVSGAQIGDLMEGTGEVVRAGGSMIFVRGLISTGGAPVLTFSSVLKRLKAR